MKVVRVSSKPLTATMSLNGIQAQCLAQQRVGIFTDFKLPGAAFAFCNGFESRLVPVSYTHLTLPTIYSV